MEKQISASLILLAYLNADSHFIVDEIPAEKITHVCYAFGQVCESGITVGIPGQTAAPESAERLESAFGKLQQLKRRNPALKLLIALGGWGGEGFSDAALTPESRTRFAELAIRFMQDRKLDGIDIDWEYPTNAMAGIKARPEDKQNFTLMLATLRQHLDTLSDSERRIGGERYLLTIAAGAAQFYVDGVELEKVASYCDFINLMTYDFYNGWAKRAGHHANLYNSVTDPDGDSGDKAVSLFLEHGVSANKIVLGCPFYGRSLSGVGRPGLGESGTPNSNGTFTYQEIISNIIPDRRYVRYWDDAAQAPWLFDGNQFISYEDTESISLKAGYVRRHGLGGAMFWDYTLDKRGVLLHALWEGLTKDSLG